MSRIAAFFAVLVSCFGTVRAEPDQDAKLEFFETHIRPVLVEHCYRCHSAESGESKGGLRLDSRGGWQIGGDSGAAIIPGKPGESLVLLAINRSGETAEMPPKSHLSQSVINDFEKWITDGAIDPRERTTADPPKATINIEEGRRFWSFQPRQTQLDRHSIDEFIRPQARPAEADHLVRRLFLDLIGLPPTQVERQEFHRIYRQHSADKAVNTFTDDLLNRPEFGEKWARHWLDVVRYADSNGGDFNLTFHESWRYRNYVIGAFNQDLPYDQFLREQIAGDLLPADSQEQRNRQLIATGFLMVGPKMLTERNKPKMHLDIADEQLNTIGKAIMGLTLGCARCHDHKFDPIPTADYYAMVGILHSTRTADRVLMNNVNVTGWTETNLAMGNETKTLVAAHQAKIADLHQQIEQKRQSVKYARGIVVDDTSAERTGPWRKSTYRPNHIGDFYLATDKGKGPYAIKWTANLPKPGRYELRASFAGGKGLAQSATYEVSHADGQTRLLIDQTTQPTIDGLWFPLGTFNFGATAEVRLTDERAGGAVIADAIQLVHAEDLAQEQTRQVAKTNGEIKKLERALEKLKSNLPDTPKAMAAQDNSSDRLGDLHIRIRGEVENLGRKVPRGFLQVADYAGSAQAQISPGESGRRQLAEWLTHPNHPLTARVMANRIWQQLFGRGIVATSDNFGVRGAKPTHPHLLDFLANEFVEHQWSMKQLIRQIVCSQTYQQASQTASAADPANAQIQHQNRRPAPAETMRDSILAIAGELDRKPRDSVVGPLGMYAIETSGKRHPSLAQTGELRQRSIYMPIVRGAEPQSLAVFDLPNPDLVTGTRAATTVPAQALFMMNSPFVRKMATSVSEQISVECQSIDEVVKSLYQRILIRDADPADIEVGRDYITQLVSENSKTRSEAIASFVQILFSSTEFRFIE